MAFVVEKDLECSVRDGTILRADVYHPPGDGRHPTLICRTPYDKSRSFYTELAGTLADDGYSVVVQDHRGTHASDGEYVWMFDPSAQSLDAADGHDAVEWAAGLPWGDGRVGAWGNSNDGWSVWTMLSTQPASLRTAFISGIARNSLAMTFGIFESGRRLQWTYTMAAVDPRSERAVPREEATRRWQDVERGKYIWWLPIGDIPADVFPGLDDQLQEYHRAQNRDTWDFTSGYPLVTVPLMQVTGWWDRLIGTVDNFAGVTRGRAAPDARSRHRLIIGPWGHDTRELTGHVGPTDYGSDADRTYATLVRRWFDYQLKGIDNEIVGEDPVQIFVPGENRWRGEQGWPLERAEMTAFYLHSGGSANTRLGDGSLSTAAPDGRTGADTDEFSYDPRDPVMSLMRADAQALPVDQAPYDARQDVLFYDTAVLDHELELVGPVKLLLWAATDGPDTDWTAKLAIVDEAGLAVNLTYGIVRAQYRNGFDRPELLDPGRVYEYDVPLKPIGVRLLPGQRLRLYVSSSDFPNFDRNHNTGRPYWGDLDLRTARQTIFHSVARPSHLVLPVIPR